MSDPYRVLLLADHKWRDLPGLASIKVRLEDQFGISAYVLPFVNFEPAAATLKPHMVVLTNMNGVRSLSIARVAKRMGMLVVVVPSEGRPVSQDLVRFVSGEFSDLSLVDLWLTWSETTRDFMVDRGLLGPDRVRVAGVARFDFYVPPLRSVLMSREAFEAKHGLVPGRPLVSWATNFNLARHVRTGTLDFLVKDFKDLGVSRIETLADPVALARKDLEVRLRTLEVIRCLCSKFREVNFVLKPHPYEDFDEYETFVARCRGAGLDNIALVTEHYIWDILNSAQIHVHRHCTTGIEAWLMGIPSINFHLEDYGPWSLDMEGPAKDALDGDDLATSAKEIEERIAFYLGGGRVSPDRLVAREEHIRRWFYRVDGNSSLRCAEEIANHLKSTRAEPVFSLSFLSLRGAAKVLLNRLPGRSFDTPIQNGRKFHNGSRVDFLGQVDKLVTRQDVAFWSDRIRTALSATDTNRSSLECGDARSY